MVPHSESDRAILVLNMIKKHFASSHYATANKIIPFIYGEMQYFRERSRLIIYCNYNDPLNADHDNLDIITNIAPRPGDLVINRSDANAFKDTSLLSELKKQNIKRLTLVGLGIENSLSTTAQWAKGAGYQVIVPQTCIYVKNSHEQLALEKILQ